MVVTGNRGGEPRRSHLALRGRASLFIHQRREPDNGFAVARFALKLVEQARRTKPGVKCAFMPLVRACWNNRRQRRFDCDEFVKSTIARIARRLVRLA